MANRLDTQMIECLKLSSDCKLGRNLARTFLDYYKLNGYISSKPSSSIVPKPGAPPHRRERGGVDRAMSEPFARGEIGHNRSVDSQ